MDQIPSFLVEDKARAERYAHLTEGISNPHVKRAVESLCATQDRDAVNESTDSTAVAIFTKIAKPLIRRVVPALVANQLVSIQPSSQPTWKVFYLDIKAGSAVAPTAKGTRFDFESGGMWTPAAASTSKFYSSGVIRGEAVATGNGTLTIFNLAYKNLKPGTTTVRVNGTTVTSGLTVDIVNGILTFGTAPVNASTIVADYSLNLEGSAGSEVDLSMSSSSVDMESKRIRSRITLEALQDFKAYHDIDAMALLAEAMGDQLKREVDRMIIDDLTAAGSATNITWNGNWSTYGGSTNGYPAQKDFLETLVHRINDASMAIYKKRFRYANFIVVAPDTLSILDKLNTFRLTSGFGADGASPSADISTGPGFVGVLSSRYKVIVDPLFSTTKILVGYKGDDWQETGYVYSPYVMFQTQTFIDPNEMIPRTGLMSRFGRHLVNSDFYATVTLVP